MSFITSQSFKMNKILNSDKKQRTRAASLKEKKQEQKLSLQFQNQKIKNVQSKTINVFLRQLTSRTKHHRRQFEFIPLLKNIRLQHDKCEIVKNHLNEYNIFKPKEESYNRLKRTLDTRRVDETSKMTSERERSIDTFQRNYSSLSFRTGLKPHQPQQEDLKGKNLFISGQSQHLSLQKILSHRKSHSNKDYRIIKL